MEYVQILSQTKILHFSLVKKANQTLPEANLISKKNSPSNKNTNNHLISPNNHYRSFETPQTFLKNSKIFEDENDSSCSCFFFWFRSKKSSENKTKSAIEELADKN